jgi:hypothetical protein
VFPVRYELGFYTPEDDILRSHSRENLIFYSINLITIQTRSGAHPHLIPLIPWALSRDKDAGT